MISDKYITPEIIR